MEALFKKYFWVLNLVVLGAVAWLIAQTVVDYVAAKYLVVRPTTAAAPTSSETDKLMAKADDGQVAQVLTDRHPFNVEPPKEEKAPETTCEPKCENKKCGDDGCSGSCGECTADETCGEEGQCLAKDSEVKESELSIVLQGTFTSPMSPAVRFANIVANGESQLVQVGSDVLGQAKVMDISPKMLYLQEGEKLTYVALWTDRAAGGPGGRNPNGAMRTSPGQPPPVPGIERPNPGDSAPPDLSGAPPPPSSADFAQYVQKESETSYKINRQMLDEQLQDLTQLGMQARVIPNYRNGKYEGFKLVGVRPGSLYRAIGIRSGDIVRSINGKAINSPNKAMELFSEFKSANSLSLEVERRGQIETIQYSIQ